MFVRLSKAHHRTPAPPQNRNSSPVLTYYTILHKSTLFANYITIYYKILQKNDTLKYKVKKQREVFFIQIHYNPLQSIVIMW